MATENGAVIGGLSASTIISGIIAVIIGAVAIDYLSKSKPDNGKRKFLLVLSYIDLVVGSLVVAWVIVALILLALHNKSK